MAETRFVRCVGMLWWPESLDQDQSLALLTAHHQHIALLALDYS